MRAVGQHPGEARNLCEGILIMIEPKFSSVLIVDQAMDSKGIIANVAFIVDLTAGRELSKETFGEDLVDGEGKQYL
jgi:hypothetical protein